MVACPCARHCAEAPHTARLGDGAAVAARHRRLPVLRCVRRPRSAGGPPAPRPRCADTTGSYRGGRKPDQPVPDGHQRRFGDDARTMPGRGRSGRCSPSTSSISRSCGPGSSSRPARGDAEPDDRARPRARPAARPARGPPASPPPSCARRSAPRRPAWCSGWPPWSPPWPSCSRASPPPTPRT